jgi:hypothetical protein
MEVTREHFVDASEPDENGYYDYYYAYHIYTFTFEQEAFVARQYDDTSDEASFGPWMRVKGKRKWRWQRLEAVPYESPTFREAVRYLLEQENVQTVKWLSQQDGYVSLDLARLR